MNTILKYALIAAGALVTLVVIAIIGLFLLFDPNDYREEIAQQLSEATGRQVRIDGELSMSLFPWVAVESGRVTMAAAPAFGPEPMLSLARASASVRLLPLFRGSVQIGTVTLSGLDLRLAVRGDGLTSWDDLVERLQPADATDATARDGSPAAGEISIAGILVEDASVSYTDAVAGSEYQLSRFGVQIDAVDLEQPIPLKAGFAFSMRPAGIDGELALATVLRLTGEDDGSQTMRFGDLQIDGQVSAPSLAGSQSFSLRSTLLALDSNANSLNLEPAKFGFGPVNGELALSGSGPAAPLALSGSLSLDRFRPADLFAALAIDAPQTTDPAALSSLQLESRLGLTFESVTLNELTLRMDETQLSGQVVVETGARPNIDFELAGDRINIDRYLPPATDAVAADGGDNLAETALPVELIRGLNAKGTLRFEQLTLGELPFEQLTLGLAVAGDKARLNPISATVLGGSYNGDVSIDASGRTPALSLNETVAGLDIGRLASLLWERDNVSGSLGGNFALRGTGETLSDIRRTLAGSVRFELSDGALTGTDLWYEIRRARAMFRQQPPPAAPSPVRTEFSTIRGSAVVSEGVATNDDLFAELPFLQLTGSGKVNLGDATIDYGMRARVLERPEFLRGVPEAELNEYTSAVIPLKVTGPLAAPSIRPDIEGMLSDAARRQLDAGKEALKDRLLEELGGEEEGKQELKDLEDEAKKKLRDLLRR